MLKKIDSILNIVIGSFIGVFIGQGIYVFWEYKTHPSLYAMQPVPWYTSIFVRGIFLIVVLIMVTVIKVMIRKKCKQ